MLVIVLARNWWVLALRGFFDILFGVAAFVIPGITLVALVFLYGAFAMVDGIFALTAVLVGHTPGGRPWWSLLLEGILGIAVGILTFAWPGITALALLYLIAAWALVTGILEITAAIRLRKEIQGEWLLALAGILSVLFALMLVANPSAGALAVVWIIGAYAIAFGVVLMMLGFRLRSWLKQTTQIPISPGSEVNSAAARGTTSMAR